jgi:hypothetical protein
VESWVEPEGGIIFEGSSYQQRLLDGKREVLSRHGLRRQSDSGAGALALKADHRKMCFGAEIQSAGAAVLCRRTP